MHTPTRVQATFWQPTVSPLWLFGALAALAVVVALWLLGTWIARRMPAGTPWWYYAGAAGGLSVSLNTSWRFFGDRLGVTGAERVVMFSVVELALVACAVGMRANVRHIDPATGRPGSPGAPRLVAWALCGLSGYAALVLSGPVDGVARVALGPVLSLVMLHLALGIEIRRRTGTHTGIWARVASELRERALSRLGLADDNRDAVTRTRERAITRAARLARTDRAVYRNARLARALRAARVAHDPLLRNRLLAELAVQGSAAELAALPLPSPWTGTGAPAVPASEHGITSVGTGQTGTERNTGHDAGSGTAGVPVPEPREASTGTARVADLASVRAKHAAAGETPKDRMRSLFDEHARKGTLSGLTGAALAAVGPASDGLGRRYLRDWTAEHEAEHHAGSAGTGTPTSTGTSPTRTGTCGSVATGTDAPSGTGTTRTGAE